MLATANSRSLAILQSQLFRMATILYRNPKTKSEDSRVFQCCRLVSCNFEAKNLTNFMQHKMEGDALIIAVAPEDADQFTELDNINFVDSKLRIVRVEKLAALEKNAECDTPNTVAVLNEVINGRYNIGQKTLDLSNLGTDQLLNNIKIFDSEARTQKFFPALMKLCETFFGNESERAEAVLKVDMRHNNLEDVRLVQTLADTFPKIKVLDLSDNRFSMKGLELWRSRFKFLEEIVMSGNPLEQESNYMDIITTWYERLQKINGVQVRTVAGAVPDAHTTLPLPILVSSFQDEGFVGENFVKQFFPTYDYDRIACINAYYDAKSTFSLSINTSAPRYPNSRSTKAVGWDSYFKKSRNLIRVTQLPAKISRLYTGAESIRDSWVKFPVTRHPSLSSEQAKWCIECSLIPSLPDPVGQSLSGVSGLVIMVHGEFAEVDLQTDQTTVTRSFDRTFILGPGGGPSGVRVACDTLILRSYGGSEAWKPQVGDYLVVHPPPPELRLPPLVPQGFSSEMPGKSEEQLLKERLAVDLSRATGMTLDSSGECLQTCNWSYEAALVTYEAVKVCSTKPCLKVGVFVC